MSEKSDETRRRLIATPLGLLNRPPLPHELIQQEQQQTQAQPQNQEGEGDIGQSTLEEVFNQGYQQGFREAEEKYALTYPCRNCRQPVPLHADSEEFKEVAAYLYRRNWGHESCSWRKARAEGE